MLDAVMLVLREVLEAALFVSLLLALGKHLGLRRGWAGVAVPLGLLASWLASHYAASLAEAAEGTGQELLNAALYLVAILSFLALTTLLTPAALGREIGPPRSPAAPLLFVLIVTCSMAREGSEVWIYLSSFTTSPTALSAAVIGGLIGTGIGLSLCALVYYAFAGLPRRVFLLLFLALATLVAGGLAMQIAKLGLQVGWLDSGQSLWDTSWLVSERSWLGQFLHALFGYDANPDRVQALFYFAALFAALLAAAMRLGWTRQVRRG